MNTEPNETDDQLSRKYHLRRRAYYSEVITGDDDQTKRNEYWLGSVKHTMYTWRVRTELYAPSIQRLIPPVNPVQLAPAERWMAFADEKSILFPVETLKPKVQLQYNVEAKKLPRKVEIERRRLAYASKNLPSILQELGVSKQMLMPVDVMTRLNCINCLNLYNQQNFLPLELFDDTDFDDRNSEEWIEMGILEGVHHPMPALAFLPFNQNQQETITIKLTIDHLFEWSNVAVIQYNPNDKLYTVLTLDGLQTIYRLPRIYIMFKAEDPTKFAARIQNAVHLRNETENLIKFELYLDCLMTPDLYEIDETILNQIFVHATRNYEIKIHTGNQKFFESLLDQIRLNYKRAFCELIFRYTVQKNPMIFSFVQIPSTSVQPVLQQGTISTEMNDFNKIKNYIRWSTLYVIPESYKAIELIVNECQIVQNMALFTTNHGKFIPLSEFYSLQIVFTNNVLKHLSTSWLERTTHDIRMSLRDVGKGWFDLNINRWETYRISKMMRLLELTKYHMQYALRVMVETSIINLLNLLEVPCQCCLPVNDDFKWGDDDLVHTQFKPSTLPIFLVVLKLEKDRGAFYDTNPDDFPRLLLQFLNNAIEKLHFIKQVQPHLLPAINWPDDMFLSSVGLIDPFVVKYRDKLELGYMKAIIPLKAYAAEYNKHMELFLLDNAAYVTAYKEQNHPAGEVRDEIARQFNLKEELEQTIPLNIFIGPFFVNTKPLRTFLVDKRADLAKRLLDMFAARMRKAMDVLSDDYKLIYIKLLEKPNSIEDIYEMRDWMETITMSVRNNEDQARRFLMEYEIFNEFFYAIKDDDFTVKWEVIGWPYKISTQVDETNLFLIDETEKFHKIQFDDEVELNDKIDMFVSKVVEYSKEKDIEKYDTIAVGIGRLWKQMKEGHERGILLNQRQKLFNDPVIPFTHLSKLIKEFEPYKTLWLTTESWFKMKTIWMDNPLVNVDGSTIEDTLQDMLKTSIKLIRTFSDFPDQQAIAVRVREECEQFKPYVPLIQAIRNPGLKDRHYEMMAKQTGINIPWSDQLTFDKCLHLGLYKHLETIVHISEAAGKEYAIEEALNRMIESWEENFMEVMPYKETGTFIMKIAEEQLQQLDDQIVQTQQISFSPFKAAFEEAITNWERTLNLTSKVIDLWNEVQKNWMYLEPIFTSEDISKQLPTESKKYNSMERIWRRIMRAAADNPKIVEFCPDENLLKSFDECMDLLTMVAKGLAEYLETKRQTFPRFFFLSDDELLEILAQSKNPLAVQPHLKKCFEAMASLKFESDLKMTRMNSGDGESVPLNPPLYPVGGVEAWMLNVEESMKNTVRTVIQAGLEDLTPTKVRNEWVLSWPGQVVIAGSQTYWTAGVQDALTHQTLPQYVEYLLKYLDGLRNLVKGNLTRLQREIVSALIVIEVHARDVTSQLLELNIQNPNDFEWISQLRYYWVDDHDLKVRAVNAEFQYGYEYLGNTGRLVITPLTDRCYLTLTGALHLNMGGAPQGPAGTGKTETTKDLGKAMAIQTVVFNCSDQLDYMAMGKFFKGLASSGAWACFDEFNRIDIEVLSVIAQQVATIQKAQKAKLERFLFEGVDLLLQMSCAVFITMNPGYAGRTELPDNLKTLFRPVAMMVPNYALIAEISLFSFGFGDARALAGKITTTFKLSSEQLSSQDHYDFGMRAVKTVIAVAGNLKRERPKMDERQIVLRALRDVNVPKFLKDDLILFNGIVCDLFPRMVEEQIDYGDLESSIRKMILQRGLEDVNEYVHKVIQLYETTVVRHGLMIVGPTGSGKTNKVCLLPVLLSI